MLPSQGRRPRYADRPTGGKYDLRPQKAGLLQVLIGKGSIGVAICYILPSDDPVSIYDKRRRRRKTRTVRKNVVDPVLPDHLRTRIVQDVERNADCADNRVGSSQVVDTDSKHLGVQILNLVVDIGQLSELSTAISSPEGPVEHQHDVLLPSE